MPGSSWSAPTSGSDTQWIFARVSQELGVTPEVLEAGGIAACYRRRAYWANFRIHELVRVEIDPNSALEAGRTTWPWWERPPKIVASGISSWNTKEVLEGEWGAVGPLHIGP